MALTNDDLEKIKQIVDFRADLQDTKTERLIAQSEERMSRKIDDKVDGVEHRLGAKIDQVQEMLEGDYEAVADDVAELKKLVPRVTKLETKANRA